MASGSYGSDAAQTDGIWSLSRTPDGFAVACEYLYNNATAITSAGIKGFLKFGDYVLAAFTDGGTYKCTLISSATYATSAPVYETVIFNGGDAASTDDAIRKTAVKSESTGVKRPLFKESSFQITSQGNAVITGLKFLYEEIL